MIIVLLILFWVACGVLSYGMHLAFCQKNWEYFAERDYPEDAKYAFFWSLGGPFALLAVYFATNRAKHGLMFRNPHKGESV